MDLLILGLNHETAPIELREQVAFTPEETPHALTELRRIGQLAETAIVSTCNRTELYCLAESPEVERIGNWFARHHGLSEEVMQSSTYARKGVEAIEHAMRVAAGLDSLVIGETQILGQMKDAFTVAEDSGTLGPWLHKLSQATFRAAKLVRSNTAIGQSRVSVASVSVQLAGQLFSALSDCSALLIGAGDTTSLVGRHLRTAGIGELVICNRTLARAQTLATELGGRAAPLSDLPDLLVQSDVVISATASQLPVLGKGTVERAIRARRHRPIFMVDLAVPRDIEPEVSSLKDIYLYTVDDLQSIVSQNRSNRSSAADEAESLIQSEAARLTRDYKALSAVDTLVSLRRHHEQLRDDELERALDRLSAGDDPEAVLRQFARQLTNKIVHTPSIELKRAGADGDSGLLASTRRLFRLDDHS